MAPIIDFVRAKPASYEAIGVHLDGTNDYLTRGADFTSHADSVVSTCAGWLNMSGSSDGTRYGIYSTDPGGPVSDGLIIRRETDNKIQVIGSTSADTTIQGFKSTTSVVAADGWVHFMFSFNATTQTQHFYLDGSEDLNSATNSTGTIEHTGTDHYVGALDGAASKFNGDMADLYVNTQEYVDLSSAANRAKFYVSHKAVDLGSDGSTPTGTAPVLFLTGAVDSWHTNVGSGGGMTETGALTAASTNPPSS
ncbi:MAG: hypothetical protein QGF59_05475 [Pirellulaceae bacterium]|jgi:hypothetical protein|nr:hypothetical protein [Pirellulaceae bacterium]